MRWREPDAARRQSPDSGYRGSGGGRVSRRCASIGGAVLACLSIFAAQAHSQSLSPTGLFAGELAGDIREALQRNFPDPIVNTYFRNLTPFGPTIIVTGSAIVSRNGTLFSIPFTAIVDLEGGGANARGARLVPIPAIPAARMQSPAIRS